MDDFILCDSGIKDTYVVICKNNSMIVKSYKQEANYIAKAIITFANCFNIRDLYIGKRGCDSAIIDSIYNELYKENDIEFLRIHESDPTQLYRDVCMIEKTLL